MWYPERVSPVVPNTESCRDAHKVNADNQLGLASTGAVDLCCAWPLVCCRSAWLAIAAIPSRILGVVWRSGGGLAVDLLRRISRWLRGRVYRRGHRGVRAAGMGSGAELAWVGVGVGRRAAERLIRIHLLGLLLSLRQRRGGRVCVGGWGVERGRALGGLRRRACGRGLRRVRIAGFAS